MPSGMVERTGIVERPLGVVSRKTDRRCLCIITGNFRHSFSYIPRGVMSATAIHSVDPLPIHKIRNPNAHFVPEGGLERPNEYVEARDHEMVALDFDSDVSTAEGLKEDQSTTDANPTFGA